MRFNHTFLILLFSTLLFASACQTAGPKAQIGGLGGAAAGGLLAATLGGDAAGIAAGTILGALIGSAIGDSMDERDRKQAQLSAYDGLENLRSGSSNTWNNPDSGNSGSFTPTHTYQTTSGQYCREYQQSINIGGEQHQSYGTACRQPDGTWKLIN